MTSNYNLASFFWLGKVISLKNANAKTCAMEIQSSLGVGQSIHCVVGRQCDRTKPCPDNLNFPSFRLFWTLQPAVNTNKFAKVRRRIFAKLFAVLVQSKVASTRIFCLSLNSSQGIFPLPPVHSAVECILYRLLSLEGHCKLVAPNGVNSNERQAYCMWG